MSFILKRGGGKGSVHLEDQKMADDDLEPVLLENIHRILVKERRALFSVLWI